MTPRTQGDSWIAIAVDVNLAPRQSSTPVGRARRLAPPARFYVRRRRAPLNQFAHAPSSLSMSAARALASSVAYGTKPPSSSSSSSSRRRGAMSRTAPVVRAVVTPPKMEGKISEQQRPDVNGRYGVFGGKYVPETLIPALIELEKEYEAIKTDAAFQAELKHILKDYVGRENPLYFAERLTDEFKDANGKGPHVYLKREDLNHTCAHKINNAVGQALLAKRMGKKRIIAETGAGQHGVATATVCARVSASSASFTWAPRIWNAKSSTCSVCVCSAPPCDRCVRVRRR